MEILAPEITKYLQDTIQRQDDVLLEMESEATQSHFPIIGPLVGRFLAQLTVLSGARRVLELGSGFGYSAYWFAKTVGKGGKVICTDRNAQNREKALIFFKRAGLLRRIEFHVGDSLEIIDHLKGKFDIILNDIDKEQYPLAFRKAIPRLKRGGLLIADNVLWSGRVVEKDPDASTRAILEFNRLIHQSPDVLTTIIPLRDGISVTLKL